METVVGMFKRLADADRAVDELNKAGLGENVNVITRETVIANALTTPGVEAQSAQAALAEAVSPPDKNTPSTPEADDLANPDIATAAAAMDVHHVPETSGKAAVGGGIVGGIAGLLVGVGAIAIPGLGPLLAAGSLVATLGATAAGAGLGAATGGILGMLAGFDIAAEHAEVYVEGLKRGCVMVLVNTPEAESEQARAILNAANAVNVTEMEHEFRADGWSRTSEAPAPRGAAVYERR